MSGFDHIRERVLAARAVSVGEVAEAMTGADLLNAVQWAEHSFASEFAAVDVFRMVLDAVDGGKTAPRQGWARL